MKRVILVLALGIFAIGAQAQNSAVSKATAAQNKGELDVAKENIDAAVQHEKTREKGKTWYTKGLVYQAIAFSDNADYRALADDAAEQAVEAFQKAISMEKENSLTSVQSGLAIDNIYNSFINEGADAYQKGDYANALIAFDRGSNIKPSDTTALVYAAITAQIDKQYGEAEKYYLRLKDLDYATPEMYKSLVYIQRAYHEDNDKAMAVIKEAREIYPEDPDLMKEEINVLIVTEQIDEAKDKLKVAIEREPDNPNLYYNLAFLHDQLGDVDESLKLYQKAADLKPDYFDAVYNIAVINFNKAAETLKVANEMDLATYQKDGQKYIDKANEQFQIAVPYFEQAHQIDPNSTEVLENLELIYKRLKMFDKVDEVQQKIAALGGGGGE